MAYAAISLDDGKTVSHIAETSEHLLNLIYELFESDENLERISIKYIGNIDDNHNISGNTINNMNATINGTQANIIQDDNIDLGGIKEILSKLPSSKRHKAIADVLDLLEEKYIEK